jgi:hypothetical protein
MEKKDWKKLIFFSFYFKFSIVHLKKISSYLNNPKIEDQLLKIFDKDFQITDQENGTAEYRAKDDGETEETAKDNGTTEETTQENDYFQENEKEDN